MIKVKFKPWHHMALTGSTDKTWAENIAKCGPAYTGMIENTPIVCAGIAPQWHGRSMAWAVLGEGSGPHMIAITRAVKSFLDSRPEERLEMQVKADFKPAHRWAKMLGFEWEGTMRKYCNGEDFDLYSRIRANLDQVYRLAS